MTHFFCYRRSEHSLVCTQSAEKQMTYRVEDKHVLLCDNYTPCCLLTASCFLSFEERQRADMMSPKCAAGAFIVSTEQIVRATISDKYDPVGAAGGVSVEQATDVTGEVSLPL